MATSTSLETERVELQLASHEAPSPTVSIQARQYFQEGMAHLQSAEPAEAVAAFSRTVEHSPGFMDAHMFLGIAHALTSNVYPALDHLEEAARLAPDSFAAHFTLAQLNFKLRIPKNGYKAAQQALRCIQTLEQRKMLTQLLKEERERERNGITRPSFNKPFRTPMLFIAGSALAAAILFLMTQMR
jgi:tetratricopeptide (TPR) repeat protein